MQSWSGLGHSSVDNQPCRILTLVARLSLTLCSNAPCFSLMAFLLRHTGFSNNYYTNSNLVIVLLSEDDFRIRLPMPYLTLIAPPPTHSFYFFFLQIPVTWSVLMFPAVESSCSLNSNADGLKSSMLCSFLQPKNKLLKKDQEILESF